MKKEYYYYIGAALLLVFILYYFFFRKTKMWAFEDNTFVDGGNLAFVGAEQPPFQKDEKITVTQAPGAKFSQYDGKTTVKEVKKLNGKWIVITTKPRQGDSPVNPGFIQS